MKSPDTDIFARQANKRVVPSDWIRRCAGAPLQSARPFRAGAGRWLTTLPHALPSVREAALHALASMSAQLAYFYEAEGKVVIRSTLAQSQIRAELTAIDPETTRIVVVSMNGDDVDRQTATEVVAAIEDRLEAGAELP
jgi:hypothetical protein